jgi:Tol biopolymer transport system component
MRAFQLSLIFALIFLLSCEHKENCPTYFDQEVSPFDYPIWHPSDTMIGYYFIPYKKIVPNPDCPDLFHYSFNGDSSGFWIINDSGQNLRRILPYRLITPSWSPDGKWIAFSNYGVIWKMPFDGEKFDTSAIVQLTNEGRSFFPSWSPDGEWIAYDSDTDSPTGLKFIWKMRKDGSEKKRIAFTPDLGETRMPCWGSDNTILHNRFSPDRQCNIYKMDSSGNNIVQITHNSVKNELISYPTYSGDCKYIYYILRSIKTNRIELWQQDLDGSEPFQLTEGGSSRFSVSKSGRIVYMKDNDKSVIGNLWIINQNGSKEQLIE